MKSQFVILLGFLTFCISINSIAQPVFIRTSNGRGNGSNIGTAVTTDSSGNSYITGYTTGFYSGHDITTIKYDAAGNELWIATYNGGGNSLDEAYAMAKDAAGNIYVTGTSVGANTDKDMVLIKYDKDGNQKWVSRYTSSGSHPDVANAITIDAGGNPIIAGYSYVNSGNAATVIKFDPLGNQLWVKTGDGTSNTNAFYSVTVDNSSNIYATGYTQSPTQGSYKEFMTAKFNSAGTRQWVATSTGDCTNQDGEAYSIVNDGSGNSYITGYVVTYSNGKDYLTIKYNSSGAQQWLKTYNYATANSDDISRKIIYVGGDVYVTGSSKRTTAANSEDFLTIRYRGSDGNQMFVMRYDDPIAHNVDIAYSLTNVGTNLIYITGSSVKENIIDGGDIFVLGINGSGAMVSSYRIPNPGPDGANDITTDRFGNIFVAGYMNSLALPTHNVTSNMAIAKFQPGPYSKPGMEQEAIIPNSFALYQNYPNPFNPSTTIRYDVSAASNVKISVYDILGKEVMSPVNEFKNPGSYEITISLNSLASGIYLYKMTAGNFSDIKKLILTK